MSNIVIGLLAALTVVLAVAAAAAPMAASFRRRAWVAAKPRLVEVFDEQLPAAVRRLLAQVEQPLIDAGFARAAAVYAPEFSGRADWTQVLFVNRSTGERASIMGHHEEGSDYFDYVLATELPSGMVTTPASEVAGEASAGTPIDVPDVLNRHRDRVGDLLRQRGETEPPSGPIGQLPPAGAELPWLQERAERVAADIARVMGYRLDTPGEKYRLPWRVALLAAANHPLGRGRRRRARFDVLTGANGDRSPAGLTPQGPRIPPPQ